MAKTRPGKGRAFLKFIIGLLITFIVCAGFYLFVQEFDRPAPDSAQPTPPVQPDASREPDATASPAPVTQPSAADTLPAQTPGAEASPDAPPQETQAASEPSPTPTPQPTPAPTPEKTLSDRMEGMSVPAQTKLANFGMIDFKLTQDTLSMSAYLSAPDISSESAQYYLVVSLASGDAVYVYDTWPAPNDTGLEIDLACFSGCISGRGLPDGWYRMGLMAVDGENSCSVDVIDDSYSFVVNAEQFIRYAD